MKRKIKSVLLRLGLIPPDPVPPDPLITFFSAISKLGFSPKHVIDVGANTGTWTRRAMEFFPKAAYTLLEPQDHLKSHIEDLITGGFEVSWINAAAGDSPGTATLTIPHRDDSSSLVPTAEQAAAAGHKRIEVKVTTLNEVVSSHHAPVPELVKIDAEGYDLKVLEGASDLFGRTEIFLIEVAVCAQGIENTISSTMKRMDEIGYRLIDITHTNRSPKHQVLWLCELAFLRNGSSLLKPAASYE